MRELYIWVGVLCSMCIISVFTSKIRKALHQRKCRSLLRLTWKNIISHLSVRRRDRVGVWEFTVQSESERIHTGWETAWCNQTITHWKDWFDVSYRKEMLCFPLRTCRHLISSSQRSINRFWSRTPSTESRFWNEEERVLSCSDIWTECVRTFVLCALFV